MDNEPTYSGKGTAPPEFIIQRAVLDVLTAQACATYPDECCGMVIVRGGREEAVPVANIQDQLHAADPAQFPRTARNAYTMGPEAGPVLIAAERGALQLRAFYHSHPDHDAYFSEEDRRQALGAWDEPGYPDAAHIVVSVRNREVGTIAVFAWNAAWRDFVQVPLTVVESC